MSAQIIQLPVSPANGGRATHEKAATSSSAPANWHTVSPLDEVRGLLNRAAFRVGHSLAGNPLFRIDALVEVPKEASKRPGDLYLDAGDVNVTDKWGHIPIPDRPVEEIILRIET